MRFYNGVLQEDHSLRIQRFDGAFEPEPKFSETWKKEHGEHFRVGLVVDIETTGFSPYSEKIIEVGARKFRFHRLTGEIFEVFEPFMALQDPGEPLSHEIQLLTGLRDEDLKEQTIDWDTFDQYSDQADLLIAHNAHFDRPFLDRHSKVSRKKIWGCSLKQIQWFYKGFTSQKLEILSLAHGFYVQAHRAIHDVNAVIKLLSLKDLTCQRPYLFELLENAKRNQVRLEAPFTPYELRDSLKRRGYSWIPDRKSWSRVVYKDQLQEETIWLESLIYKGDKFPGTIDEIPLQDHFKRSTHAR